MIFSMQQIYAHSETDLLPKGFLADILPQAIHGLHLCPMSGRFDKRSLFFLSLMVSQMIDNGDELA